MPKNAKYTPLLGDPEIRRWHANVARGSRITADVYLRRLGAFCSSHSLAFRDLLQMEERNLKNLLLDFITEMEEKGYAGSYIKSTVKAVKSWLRHNSAKIPAYIKINGADDTPTLAKEQSPTSEQLSRVFSACWLDARAAAALIAFTSMRPQVIKVRGNKTSRAQLRYDIGEYGIRVYPIPETKFVEKVFTERVETGIEGLDRMLNGGPFKGSTTMVAGALALERRRPHYTSLFKELSRMKKGSTSPLKNQRGNWSCMGKDSQLTF